MSSFAVKIPFFEPTFAQHIGVERKYSITIPIEAQSEKQARELAIREFKDLAEKSSVHWARNIVEEEIEVETIDETRE